MPDSLSLLREFKFLEGRRIGSGLNIEELERWMRLKQKLDEMTPGRKDRRKTFRVATHLRCLFDQDDGKARGLQRSVISDLSDGGAFIRTSTPLPAESRLELKLDLEDGTTLDVSAVVVTSQMGLGLDLDKCGMGVRFTGLDEQTRAKICKLYETLCSQSSCA